MKQSEHPILRATCILMAVIVWGAGRGLEARTIQVILGGDVRPTLHGPAGGAGTTWNARGLIQGPLRDSAGNNTNVTFTAAGEGPYGDWWCDLELLTGGVFDKCDGSLPLVISGLEPQKTYDLYIASSWGGRESFTSFSCSNPCDTPSPRTADNRTAMNGTVWVPGVNYVLFQNIVPDGSGQLNLSYGASGTYGILNGFQLVETGLAAVTYESWAANPAQGLTAGLNDGPLDDPDQDGISNLLEFTLDGKPMDFSRTASPKLTRSGEGWVFEYDRNDLSRPPGTTQVVEYSADLVTWSAVTVPSISSDNVTITDRGTSDHVEVAIPSEGGGSFARLRVTR